jgi:hypothetical protein
MALIQAILKRKLPAGWVDQPHRLLIQPESYSWSAMGGPKEAVCDVYGTPEDLIRLSSLVGNRIEFVDEWGITVWWGFIDKSETFEKNLVYGAEIDSMFNRIKAVYSLLVEGSSQASEKVETVWFENTRSVAEFGVREKILSLDNKSTAQAEYEVIRELDQTAKLRPVLEVRDRASKENKMQGRLYCRGIWETLNWMYYENSDTTAISYKDQILKVLTQCGQFIYGSPAFTATASLISNQFREGNKMGMDEIEEMLDIGSEEGKRIVATIDQNSRILFREVVVPQSDYLQYAMDTDLDIWFRTHKLPRQHCTVGIWVDYKFGGIEMQESEYFTMPFPAFIETASYNVKQKKYKPDSMSNPYELMRRTSR